MKLPFVFNNNHNNNNNSLESKISHWSSVLDIAINARENAIITQAIPSVLFRECHGLLLLQVTEVSCIVGVSRGSGLLLSTTTITITTITTRGVHRVPSTRRECRADSWEARRTKTCSCSSWIPIPSASSRRRRRRVLLR